MFYVASFELKLLDMRRAGAAELACSSDFALYRRKEEKISACYSTDGFDSSR